MKIQATVHGEEAYNDKLRDFFREAGKEEAVGLRQEARLMAVSLCTETQPFGKDKEAQKLGQSAVERDIKHLLITPQQAFGVIASKDGKTLAREFYVLTEQGKPSDAEHLLRNKSSSALRGVPVSRDADASIHAANRTNKGRVRAGVGQIVTNLSSRARLIKEKQKLVGWAKSGWATCARLVGGTRGIPGWVSRNKGQGSVIDHSTNPIHPGVTLKNEVSYIDKVLRPEGVANAFKIGRNRIEKMIAIALRKARAKARLK